MRSRSMASAVRALMATTVLAGLSVASAAVAQTAGTDDKQNEEIVVTGSAIPVSPGAVAVPVTVVGAEAIAKNGVATNVLEILRKAVPAFGGRSSTGNSNASNNNQNTAGGSSIQIRNLDTLVLVNGRRVAVDSVAGINGKVFVNVAEISPAAIERIEVLTDGASAIYGSEAIGGVVNIILKSKFEGGRVSARFGGAEGGYNEKSIDAVYGINPGRGTNIVVSASFSKSSPLYRNQRPFSSPFYSTSTTVPGSIGGRYYLNPGLTAPTPATASTITANTQYTDAGATTATAPGTGIGGTYDLAPYTMLLLGQEQRAAGVSLTTDLTGTGSVELFANAQYSQNKSFAQFIPAALAVTAPAGSPFNPLTVATAVVFGSTANPVQYHTTKEALRGTLGLRGSLPSIGEGWTWEVGYTHSQNQIDQTVKNVIYNSNLLRAVSGGYNAAGVATPGGTYSMVIAGTSPTGTLVLQPALNPFAVASAVAPGSLANVLTDEVFHGESRLDSFDGKLTGTIGHLPGGKPSFAVGAAWRKEAIKGGPTDPNFYANVGGRFILGATGTQNGATQNLITGNNVFNPFDASRTITSQYGEVRVPVTGADWNIPGAYRFDLIGAVRHEKYSDFGESTVPKFGFLWQPVPRQITVRGTFSKSYTAPSLYQFGGPVTFGNVGNAVFSGAFGSSVVNATGFQQGGSNPDLKPANSKSWSFGLVLKPDFAPRLNLDIEFTHVRETGQIAGIGLNNILIDVNNLGSASQFYNNIATGGLPGTAGAVGFATPGAVKDYVTNPANATNGVFTNLYLRDVPTNLGLIDVKSLNVALDYSIPTDHSGTFAFSSQAAFLLNFKYQAIPSQPIYEFAGTTTQGGGAQGTLPRLRMYNTLNWTLRNWSASLGHTYISGVDDIGPGGFSYFTNLASSPASFAAGKVKSFHSFDVRLGYTTSEDGEGENGLSITAGINNLFNRMPPVSTNIDPNGGHAAGAVAWRAENNTDVATYGALGRLFYVSAAYKF